MRVSSEDETVCVREVAPARERILLPLPKRRWRSAFNRRIFPICGCPDCDERQSPVYPIPIYRLELGAASAKDQVVRALLWCGPRAFCGLGAPDRAVNLPTDSLYPERNVGIEEQNIPGRLNIGR